MSGILTYDDREKIVESLEVVECALEEIAKKVSDKILAGELLRQQNQIAVIKTWLYPAGQS